MTTSSEIVKDRINQVLNKTPSDQIDSVGEHETIDPNVKNNINWKEHSWKLDAASILILQALSGICYKKGWNKTYGFMKLLQGTCVASVSTHVLNVVLKTSVTSDKK